MGYSAQLNNLFSEEIKMTKRKIFVHGRAAHADDFMATAIIMYAHPGIDFEVIRDDSRLNEATEEDFVLDCGCVTDGVRKFDHHQLTVEPGKGSECAATLVAHVYAPWMFTDPKYGPALESIRILDTLGPDWYTFFYNDLWDIFREDAIRRFSAKPTEAARELAQTLTEREYTGKKMPDYQAWLRDNASLEDDVFVIGNPWKVFDPAKDLKGLLEAIGYETKTNQAKATVFWDNFDQCWSLFRTWAGDQAGIDLARCTPAEPKFVHPAGFLCKFFGDIEQWRGLYAQAKRR